ncbi:PD-(D/E)XK nuclease family protein [Helicobacter cholecystus]|uniref:PD-(D/E)XK nuclease family protein n=1 Tax=Helicobacter cholecystus TaxID=45498 RepID=UPI0027398046|nr:PD-(D/E)XK nuclease family protein [Helicobacter cholecystus]
MNHRLYVFSSSRAMQEFLKTQKKGFLPQSMLIHDFFSQILIVEGKSKIPAMMRKILLSDVLSEFKFNDKESEVFFFEKNFLGYLETSSFLITFFNELNAHKIAIKDIPQKDIYGDYEDHLHVLERIYECYEAKLEEYGLYDFPQNASIFNEFIESFEGIEIFLDGFLTPFEIDILKEISQKIELLVHLRIDEYNLTHYDFLSTNFQVDNTYTFSLSTQEILHQTPSPLLNKPNAYSCTLRLDQCAFILKKIQQWLNEGIAEDEIAIILPQDDFRSYLKVSDEARNLNFAMGFEAKEFLEQIKAIGEKECHGDKLEFLIDNLKGLCIPEGFEVKLDEIIYIYQKMHNVLQKLNLAQIVHLLALEVEKMSVDDFGGGKVRVMGLLETRGLKLKRAIIPDFISSNIPKISQSDIFLNTKIRKALGMPTLKDRQDLQKHYYLEIFKNTQEVELLYLEGELAPFGREVGVNILGQNHYTLFEPAKKYQYSFDEARLSIDKDFKLSFTSLSCFKDCKRAFYWRYLKGLKEESESEAMSIGLLLHELLYESYKQDPQNAKIYFERQLLKRIEQEKSEVVKFELRLYLKQMQKFFSYHLEYDEILGLEEGFEFIKNDLRITGKIDRIDRVGDRIFVIDYKSGKKADVIPLQSAIYASYIQEKYPHLDVHVCFYSLRNGELKEDRDLQKHIQELEKLLDIAKEEREFAMTLNRSKCRECSYKVLCNR